VFGLDLASLPSSTAKPSLMPMSSPYERRILTDQIDLADALLNSRVASVTTLSKRGFGTLHVLGDHAESTGMIATSAILMYAMWRGVVKTRGVRS